MRTSDELEEILQAVLCVREVRGEPVPEAEVFQWTDAPAAALEEAVHAGLVVRQPGGLRLSDEGLAAATQVVRRHRLAERLLHDVLRIDDERAVESSACRFEHVLEDEVTESVCTLLGHPRVCPHGKPIPPGPCCTRGETNVNAVVYRLSDLRAGESGTVVYVHTASAPRLDRLASFGLVPGTPLRVQQTWPSVVIEVGETHLALDVETAGDVFVRKVPPLAEKGGRAGAGPGRRARRSGQRRGS